MIPTEGARTVSPADFEKVLKFKEVPAKITGKENAVVVVEFEIELGIDVIKI